MNELSRLKPPEGAVTKGVRVGRGLGSGLGKTCGRGQKGQKARRQIKRGFEGGQMPLRRRLPKRGFTNIFRKEYAIVNLAQLERFDEGATVDRQALEAAGLVKGQWDGVKVLAKGELTRKLNVKVDRISQAAREAIEKLGGHIEVVGG
ncbi:MAG: 50S ribosomal protein L15 [Myxococcales bacterium]